jgi:hypothetical protein
MQNMLPAWDTIEIHTISGLDNLEDKDHLENLGMYDRIILE